MLILKSGSPAFILRFQDALFHRQGLVDNDASSLVSYSCGLFFKNDLHLLSLDDLRSVVMGKTSIVSSNGKTEISGVTE